MVGYAAEIAEGVVDVLGEEVEAKLAYEGGGCFGAGRICAVIDMWVARTILLIWVFGD